MIGAAQVDDLFAERGIKEREAQKLEIEIQWLGWKLVPYWMSDDTLCIPMNASDWPDELDPVILAGRPVWMWYAKNDEIAKYKMKIFTNLIRKDFKNRPLNAEFFDGNDHLRRLTDAGWKDMGGPMKEGEK